MEQLVELAKATVGHGGGGSGIGQAAAELFRRLLAADTAPYVTGHRLAVDGS